MSCPTRMLTGCLVQSKCQVLATSIVSNLDFVLRETLEELLKGGDRQRGSARGGGRPPGCQLPGPAERGWWPGPVVPRSWGTILGDRWAREGSWGGWERLEKWSVGGLGPAEGPLRSHLPVASADLPWDGGNRRRQLVDVLGIGGHVGGFSSRQQQCPPTLGIGSGADPPCQVSHPRPPEEAPRPAAIRGCVQGGRAEEGFWRGEGHAGFPYNNV